MNIKDVLKILNEKAVVDALHGALEMLGNLGVRDEFTYAEAIKSLVNKLPKDPKIVKGAILRKAHVKGVEIFLLGLDAKEQPIHGMKVVTKKIDEELDEAFGKTDLIMVE